MTNSREEFVRHRTLARQIDRVVDEGSGREREVLVRLASPARQKLDLIEVASSLARQRNMALTAREVLPPAPRRRRSTASGGKGDPGKSFALEVERRKVGKSSLVQLQRSGAQFLAPLDKWRPRGSSKPRHFWASKAMCMRVRVDDLKQLLSVPQVREVHANRVLQPPRLVSARSLPSDVEEVRASSWGVNKIGALAAWGAYGARGKGIKIGIVDTGIDPLHPDLVDRIQAFAEFDAEGAKVAGATAHDSDKHGTHCAGTLCGGRNSGQWIGVAPEAKVVVALVLGKNGGTDAQVLAGLQWLIEQEVDVISMSLGGLTLDHDTPHTYTETIVTALRAGIPVVTAIGNEGHQTTGSPGNDLFAFAVGATDVYDGAAGFSGGRTHIIQESNFVQSHLLPLPYMKPDVSAPGVGIYSSIPGKKWEAFNGTSMATPHVAGAIALLLSATKIKSQVPRQERAFFLQDLLTGAAEELGESGQNQRFGFGRIDVLRAIDFAAQRGLVADV